jgi:hypothetical protein
MNSLGVALIILGLALFGCGLIFLMLDRRARSSDEEPTEEDLEEVDHDLQVTAKERGEVDALRQ